MDEINRKKKLIQ